ncbi:MAG: hypothetical protein WD041_03495 [Nitriliruptoraceae bacterium]
MLNPVVAGRVMIGIAIVGVVASLVAAVIGRQLVTDFEDGLEQSLALSAGVLDTVDDSFDIAEDSLDIVTAGVTDAEGAVDALGRSMAEGQTALEALRALTGGNVADALDALGETLPAVEQAATSIDRTLAALSALPFGPSYAPQRPFGETIGELRQSIAGLPEELRDQAEQAERTSDELTVATERTVATADALGALAERLAVVSELVTEYSQRTAQAREVVEDQRHALAASATWARVLVVGFSALFAVGQLVPLYLGFALSRGHLTLDQG